MTLYKLLKYLDENTIFLTSFTDNLVLSEEEWTQIENGYSELIRRHKPYSETRKEGRTLDMKELVCFARRHSPIAIELFHELGRRLGDEILPQWDRCQITNDWLKKVADVWEELANNENLSRTGFEDLSGETLRVWVFDSLKGSALMNRIHSKVFGVAENYRHQIQKSQLPHGAYSINMFSKRDEKVICASFRQTDEGVLLLKGSDFSEHAWGSMTREINEGRRKIREEYLENGKLSEDVLFRTMRIAASVAYGAQVDIWRYVKNESGEILGDWRDALVLGYIAKRYPNLNRRCPGPKELTLPAKETETYSSLEAWLEACRIPEKRVRFYALMEAEEWEKMRPSEEERKAADELSIDELELSIKLWNALRHAGINTVGQILQMESMGEIRKIRGLGKGFIGELATSLYDHGYYMFDNGKVITPNKS